MAVQVLLPPCETGLGEQVAVPPEPLVTLIWKVLTVKLAVTFFDTVMPVKLHGPVPVQSPPQPLKV